MNRDQYIALLRTPSTINLNMVKGLEEISERFPYFQNAHILLAKQYHGHENIRYESYLKKAAAYAGNRDLLFRLINTPPPEIIHMRKEEPETVTPVAKDSLNTDQEPAVQTFMEAVRDDEQVTDAGVGIHEEDILTQIEQSPVEELSDQFTTTGDEDIPAPVSEKNEQDLEAAKEIIEKRLREIEQQKQFEQKAQTVEQNDQQSSIAETNENNSAEITIPEIAETTIAIDKKEENFIDKNSVKVEELSEPPAEKVTKAESHEVHSFLDWLKIKNATPVPVEKPLEYFSGKEAPPPVTDDIVDKFIKTEPRIVPQRAEFYSPGNMARKSLEVHDDLITETLAKIYAGQGHLTEAIESYRKLCLKYPEKSGYFAARISELEKEIRNKE